MTRQHLAYPALIPEVVCLHDLPERLQRMILVLIEHQEAICRYKIGHVEVHYHDRSVSLKNLVEHLTA